MAVSITTRSPLGGTVVSPGTSVTLTCSLTGNDSETFDSPRLYYRRRHYDTWLVSLGSGGAGSCSVSASVFVNLEDQVEWYVVIYYHDKYGDYHTAMLATWKAHAAPDTTDPTITDVTPATGNAIPEGQGVKFQATLADNYAFSAGALYIDDELEASYNSAGLKTYYKKLSLGAHTYQWTAEDSSGNTVDTGTVNITVVNGLPEVPSGAVITVAGETGAVEVANLGNVLVTWDDFLDGNPEDSLTYTLEARAAGGAWGQVATGLTSPQTHWTPNLGLAQLELRVKANDGTGDSAYLTRTGITVLSSQSPNEPTLTSPVGGETWREGELRNITWTPAAIEHPEGLACTYEMQFSANGTFSDAVIITTGADDGSYAWTLPTDLV